MISNQLNRRTSSNSHSLLSYLLDSLQDQHPDRGVIKREGKRKRTHDCETLETTADSQHHPAW